jgi:hypothetical protein
MVDPENKTIPIENATTFRRLNFFTCLPQSGKSCFTPMGQANYRTNKAYFAPLDNEFMWCL